jgi:hypothetical protein
MEGPGANGVIEVDVPTIPAVLGSSVVIHYIDAQNFISITHGGVWIILELTANVTAQNVSAGAIANGDHLTIRLSGSTLALFVNGQHRASLPTMAAAKVTEESHGFSNASGTTGRFDNWELFVPSPFDPGALPPHSVETFTVDSVDARIMLPVGWDEGVVCVFHPGGGQDYLSTSSEYNRPLVSWLLHNNYAVATASAEPWGWGNQAQIDTYNALSTYLVSNYAPSSQVILGQSQGGTSAANTVIDGTHTFTHVAFVAAVLDLEAIYSANIVIEEVDLTALIDTAFGINGTPYADATAGYDPILELATAWTGMKVGFWASYSDAVVSRAAHSDAFEAHIDGEATTTLTTTYGGHFNTTNQPADQILSFLAT